MATDVRVPDICPLCGFTYSGGVPDEFIYDVVWWKFHRRGLCVRRSS